MQVEGPPDKRKDVGLGLDGCGLRRYKPGQMHERQERKQPLVERRQTSGERLLIPSAG